MSVTIPNAAGGTGRPASVPALVPGLDIATLSTGEDMSFASVLRDVPVPGAAPVAARKAAVALAVDDVQNPDTGRSAPEESDSNDTPVFARPVEDKASSIAGQQKIETPPAQVISSQMEISDDSEIADRPNRVSPQFNRSRGESSDDMPVAIRAKADTNSPEKAKRAEGRREREAVHAPVENAAAREPAVLAQTIPTATPVSVQDVPVESAPKAEKAGATISDRTPTADTESKVSHPISPAKAIAVHQGERAHKAEPAGPSPAEHSPAVGRKVKTEKHIHTPSQENCVAHEGNDTGHSIPVPSVNQSATTDAKAKLEVRTRQAAAVAHPRNVSLEPKVAKREAGPSVPAAESAEVAEVPISVPQRAVPDESKQSISVQVEARKQIQEVTKIAPLVRNSEQAPANAIEDRAREVAVRAHVDTPKTLQTDSLPAPSVGGLPVQPEANAHGLPVPELTGVRDRPPSAPDAKPAPVAAMAQRSQPEKPVVAPQTERAAEATALLDLIQNKQVGDKTPQPRPGVFGQAASVGGKGTGRIADGVVRISSARDKGALSKAAAVEKPSPGRQGAAVSDILAHLRPAGKDESAITVEAKSRVVPVLEEKSDTAVEGRLPAVAEKAQKMLQDVRASLAGLFGKSGNDAPQTRDDVVEPSRTDPGRSDPMVSRLTPSLPTMMAPIAVSPAAVMTPAGEFTISGALGQQVVDMGVSGQWIEDIARQVASIATNPGYGSFRMASDTLGAVLVDIRQGAQGSDIMIATENDAAQAALSQDRDRLMQDARLAAIRIGELRIEKVAAPGDAARGDMQGNSQQGGGTSHSGGQSQSGSQSAAMQGGGQNGQYGGQQGGRPDASAFAGDGQRGNSPKSSFTQSVLNDAANGRGEAERGQGRGDRARYA